MKRLLAWILLGVMAVSLCGCAAESATPETNVVETEAPAVETAAVVAETVKETAPSALTGSLFLKVSSIDFSLVGESEDIYLGLVPREDVTWESDDPDVVSVENGVLTATGVGSTTVRAVYGDQKVACTAGCLAQTQEDLKKLSVQTIRAPKRLPPETDMEKPCTFFDNAAIVGDSNTYFLMQRESKNNYLGDMLFLCRGGVSMHGFVHRFKNIYFRGKEMYLEDAIAKSQVERVYFMMGSNDVGSKTQGPFIFDNWNTMVERIREKHPTVEIVLISNIPQFAEDKSLDGYNQKIVDYNEKLRQFAEENGCMYLDLCYYIQDHNGRMPEIYHQGSYHLNELGCLNWMKIMRYYVQYETEGGVLS